jgi:hypothetical protein
VSQARDQQNLIAVIMLVVGLIALAIGVIYLTVKASALPSFLGQLHSYTGYRSKRGVVAVIGGAVLLLPGGGLLFYRPRVKR